MPPDGRWVIRFNAQNKWAALERAIASFKFHTGLKRRLDNAIEIWYATQPDEPIKPLYKEDGWKMSIHAPWSDDTKLDPPA